MEANLAHSFRDLKRRKARLLEDLARWPPQLLDFHPVPHAWSPLQVVDHLYRSEEGIFEAMRSSGQGNPIPTRDRLNSFALNLFFQLPVRVSAPGTVPQILPAAAPQLPELTLRWAALRGELEQWLAQLTPGQCRVGRFRHPVAGWMTVPTALFFLRVHLRHHVYQLRRIRRSAPNESTLCR